MSGGSVGARAQMPGDATGSVTLARVLPGLFPPAAAGLAGTERRIVLWLVVLVGVLGTAVALAGGQATIQQRLALAWAGVAIACAVPWHRLSRGAFSVVPLAVTAWTALLVQATGGATSPYSGFYYLAVILGAVVVPPLWLGIAVGAVAAAANLAPVAYAATDALERNELFVRAGLLLTSASFASWLTHELTRVVVIASTERQALGHEQDVATEMRRLQGLRQEYMAVIAHELRNPLIAVGAAARVVAKDVQGRPSEAMANGIVQEIRHALDLLDGLTDVSSLESGRLRIVLRPTELTGLIRSTVNGQAPEHTIGLTGVEQPIVVLADEARIAQVIRNLVGNAAKYSPLGTTIEVRAGLGADRRSAIVQIRDEGPGIPPLERAQLFERFSRLSTAGATRGSGLGLYISRGIVRDHHGDLTADWPPGGGTVFTFSLPLASDATR